jgi:hypothetical protein
MYAAYLELFAAMPLAVRTGNRVFLSHSIPTRMQLAEWPASVLEQESYAEKELRHGGAVYALLWGRDTSAATVESFLQRVDADLLITGHIPCDRGYATPNERQLILDSHGTPACCCLFPANHQLRHQDLLRGVKDL